MKYLIIIITAMMLCISCTSKSGQLSRDNKLKALTIELQIAKEKNFQYRDSLRTVKYNNVDHCVYYGKETPHIHDCERK